MAKFLTRVDIIKMVQEVLNPSAGTGATKTPEVKKLVEIAKKRRQ